VLPVACGLWVGGESTRIGLAGALVYWILDTVLGSSTSLVLGALYTVHCTGYLEGESRSTDGRICYSRFSHHLLLVQYSASRRKYVYCFSPNLNTFLIIELFRYDHDALSTQRERLWHHYEEGSLCMSMDR
jgi:hypothetical protein